MTLDTSTLAGLVAKFRKGSPNIAAAFDETRRLLETLDSRLARLEPVTPPPPPPTPTAPWSGWSHEVTGSQVALPNRHFAYANDKVTLTRYPDTARWDATSGVPARQLVSAWIPGGAQAREGVERTYQTDITFPAGWNGTPGESTFLLEMHTSNGQLSCGIGARCDFPAGSPPTSDPAWYQPGTNPRWFLRPIGPNGSPPLSEMIGPPIVAGRTYRVRVTALWSSTAAARWRVWIDDVLAQDSRVPNLWPGDSLAFGFYNYQLAGAFTSSVEFTRPVFA